MNKCLSGTINVRTIAIASAVCCGMTFGQTGNDTKRNDSFVMNVRSVSKDLRPQTRRNSFEPYTSDRKANSKTPSVSTYSIADEVNRDGEPFLPADRPLESVYTVGVGDVLVIDAQNIKVSFGKFTVLADGTIDFPLAGERVHVRGQTTDSIGVALSDSVRLFQTTMISVKICEYVSHGVLVKGMVDVPGFHQIQRDAVPLFVIRAAVIASPLSDRVSINREKDGSTETYLLKSINSDALLVYPGDEVEFTDGNRR